MIQKNEKILVVEDDEQIRGFIGYALANESFDWIAVGNGLEALERQRIDAPDIMILDLGLPDIDGMEVIRQIREQSQMPIIVVSARDREDEKIRALDLGADDYITKPFSASELMARIRVARRHLQLQRTEEEVPHMQVRDLSLDAAKRLAFLKGEELHLTPMEYKLLSFLFTNIGKVVTTGAIIDAVWGAGYGSDTQALRTLMAGLRRKIEKNPGKPEYIVTEIGVGYRLKDE
jgi:two-component system KDP operon response regulator KdpE